MSKLDFGLFAPTGADLRNVGMSQTNDHASTRWKVLAAEAITWCAENLHDFTTDDVWAYLARSGRDIIETERNSRANCRVYKAHARLDTGGRCYVADST